MAVEKHDCVTYDKSLKFKFYIQVKDQHRKGVFGHGRMPKRTLSSVRFHQVVKGTMRDCERGIFDCINRLISDLC